MLRTAGAVLGLALVLMATNYALPHGYAAAQTTQYVLTDENHVVVRQMMASRVFESIQGLLWRDTQFRVMAISDGWYVVFFEVLPRGAHSGIAAFYFELAAFALHNGEVIMATVSRRVVGDNYVFYQRDLFTQQETAIRSPVTMPNLPPLPQFPSTVPMSEPAEVTAGEPVRSVGRGTTGSAKDSLPVPSFAQ